MIPQNSDFQDARVVLNVLVTAGLKQKLQARALIEKRSSSELVRSLLEAAFRND